MPGCYGVFALRGEGIRENLRTRLRALFFFFLCEVFFSLFSISFFFVLYVSKKERKNQATQEDVFGFGFGVR